MVDPVKNFAKVTVSIPYDNTATSILLNSGDGAKLPNPITDGYFNLVWWNLTDYPDPSDDSNKEIVRCTANSSDTLTIIRAQEATSATNKNTSGKTYKMALTFTAKMIPDLQTDAQDRIDTHASLYTDVHGISAGLDVSKPASPAVGQRYIAVDTQKDYECYVTGTWRDITATHTASTASVHNFDSSGNAPPQIHGKTKHDSTTVDGGATLPIGQLPIHGISAHTGTIGTWSQIDKTTSNIADITTKGHGSLTDGVISGTTNSHGMIDTHISSNTGVHGVGSNYVAIASGSQYTAVNKAGDTMSGPLTVSAQYASAKYTGGTTLNWNNGNVQSITLANGTNTFSFSNGVSGGRYMLILTSGGSSQTVTWPSNIRWAGGAAPTLTLISGQHDIITFVYDGTNYLGGASLNYSP